MFFVNSLRFCLVSGAIMQKKLEDSIKELVGIIEGISIDGEINIDEIRYLDKWFEKNESLICSGPYKKLVPIIAKSLENGGLSSEERDNIMTICDEIIYGSEDDILESDVKRLFGIMNGILADGVISRNELIGLREWLEERKHLANKSPYKELIVIIEEVLDDGVIDDDEKQYLESLFNDYSSRVNI